MNPERLVARPGQQPVQHRELATSLVDLGVDVEIGHASRSLERGELVEVRGEEAGRLHLVDDVLRDGPSQSEAVVRGRPSAELVDDDQRRRRRRLENGGRLEHLRHER